MSMFLNVYVQMTIVVMALSMGLSAQATIYQPASITASHYQDGNPPAHAADHNLATRWSALDADNHYKPTWIEYELAQPEPVNTIRIAWYLGDKRVSYFSIYVVYEDGSEDSYYRESTGKNAGFESYRINLNLYRVVKVVIFGWGNSKNNWVSVSELEVAFETYNSVPTEIVSTVAASDTQVPNYPYHIFDGDVNTRWSAQGYGETLYLTWLKPRDIAGVRILWYRPNPKPRENFFAVYYWNEDVLDYQNVFEGASAPTSTSFETYMFEDVIHSDNLKLVGYGNSINDWNSIVEIQFVEAN